MFIVSSFILEYNKKTKLYSIKTDEVAACPLCGGALCYRDCKRRKLKSLIGDIRRFLLRRFRCQSEGCKKLHTELPDIIQPYKHYESAAIQAVIDDSEEAAGCVADNSTIHRWNTEFSKSAPDISQRLTAVYAETTDELVPIKASSELLDKIRGGREHWLPFVMGLLINNGHKICTQFAFCPSVNYAKVNSAVKNNAERGRINVKTIKDTS